jgi:superfamily II DNA helicase RecQ
MIVPYFLSYYSNHTSFAANLIQEAGRAGRDGNTAIHVIFFSKKDIRTNYSIIAEYRET